MKNLIRRPPSFVRRTLASALLASSLGVGASLPAWATSPSASNAHHELTAHADAKAVVVASGAVKVVVVVNRGLNAKSDRISTYVSTNPTTIDLLLAKINHLPKPLVGVFCPADFGASITLRFYRAGATTPYAVVVAQPGGCGGVTVRSYNAMDSLTRTGHFSGGGALGVIVAQRFHIKTLEII
jgi:hypothetical protein